ncbi:sensor histidine kinase [Amycolatopsis sp.]|uniref:sensor histidine kinase n=1 Tax=Amycolatopsis sp. TaxID=37632 RepID=UPI002E0293FC|nr:sensor histidine kinase [Amycolatopsis sp.]
MSPLGLAKRYAVELAVSALVLGEALFTSLDDASEVPHRLAFGLTLTVLACASLFLRRRFPLPVAAFTLLACGLYYPLTEPDGIVLLTFAVGLYTAAAEGHVRGAIALSVAAMAGVTIGEFQSTTGRHVDNFAFFLMTGWFIAVIAVGAVTRYRREAERTKETEARRRETEERLRIARKLHDVLGHHLALINVQAGAALHLKDPEQTEEALGTIKRSSKEALQQLRATLGMLRQVDMPGLADIDKLAESLRANGLSVRTEIAGTVRDLPADVDLAAFRVVQEALTNVTRHAAASAAVVRITYTDHDVSVRIDDNGSGGQVAPGNGIRGMSERAAALGGELTVAALPEDGFRVHTRLPL